MKKADRPHIVSRISGGIRRQFFRLTWTDGGKRKAREIMMTSQPDTPEFDIEYWSIRTGKSHKITPPVPKTSWRVLVVEYRTSSRYKRLKAGTKKPYDRVIEQILAKNADRDVGAMTRQQVRDVHKKYADTPRKADWYVQVISLLLNFAINTLDWDVKNVAEGIELYGKQREFEPWPDWMIQKIDTAPESVRAAIELILGTGQRPNAAIQMRHDHFHGEWMDVLDEKGGERFEVFCPIELRSYVAKIPKRGAYVLARNLTTPMGYNVVEKAFRSWRNNLGKEAAQYSLHGLRKLAIIRLAEAGCTDAQIQAVTNQSPEMVAYYRKRANRKLLSKAAREHGTEQDQNGNV